MSNPSTEPFLWGTATASYQVEGGRAPSIWDIFAHTPGKVERGETGDVACDHYHRYREDVAPDARSGNPGLPLLDFQVEGAARRPRTTEHRRLRLYDRLVDELVTAGLTPFATLFHWDLPQTLQDRGAFANVPVRMFTTAGWYCYWPPGSVCCRFGPRRSGDSNLRASCGPTPSGCLASGSSTTTCQSR
jgi:beta-glucosidase/6-phospho-beta-glucosidase/beta-galactosidase